MRMFNIVLVLVMAVFLSACGKDTETTVTVEDQDGKQTEIVIREKQPEKAPEPANTMDGHPLAKYNSPEDARILSYFPMMVGYCGEKYSKERCEMGVKLFIEKADQIGRQIEEKHVNNTAFIKFQLDVIQSGKDKSNEIGKLPLNKLYPEMAAFGKEQNERLDAFRKGTY